MVDGTAGSVIGRDASGVTTEIAPGPAGSVLTIFNNEPQFLSPLIPSGAIIDYWGAAAPNGWLACDGRTIGPLSSSATGLNDASAEALFKHIWNNFSNTIAPVTPSRGASADADWADGTKVIKLPDLRCRVTMCVDTENESVAAQTTMTAGNYGADITSVGINGGSSTHILAANEMPPHKHPLFIDATVFVDDGPAAAQVTAGYQGIAGVNSSSYFLNFTQTFVEPTIARTGTVGGASTLAVAADPHVIIQPTVTVLKIIKI